MCVIDDLLMRRTNQRPLVVWEVYGVPFPLQCAELLQHFAHDLLQSVSRISSSFQGLRHAGLQFSWVGQGRRKQRTARADPRVIAEVTIHGPPSEARERLQGNV